ncbi:hypothetical protein HNQ80_002752 [Anaerosolibacter carboniphilus]|uniref:DUF3866 domain-containing protein n=1 Tax=Anaerosolibacter carboniphilus TaxID=1417629 RepID=A0A841KWL5_9FIRM|nr:DUF3866 family protein [Anaerosolibacter carboniphilus]MBB6216648.1 hypothetical protein [Anaerosolibacter carboniphilus]
MMNIKYGKVTEVIIEKKKVTEVYVDVEGKKQKAINYNHLTGDIKIDDSVLLNTTAIDLGLGTGGYHFVICNLDRPERSISSKGHIMKLRYTPYQLKVFAAEEQESEYHHVFHDFQSLLGMPVIVGTLHSMLPAIIETLISLDPNIRIAYIMTDGAALPLDLSNLVFDLKENKKLCGTVTIGHAFGGDLECVNIYNGLIATKEILKADITVITMGPGIVGTGTKYGFTGIEQGNIVDAVTDLGGTPIAIPRISFTDQRPRHQGISHHSITVLDTICKTSAIVGIPIFEGMKHRFIEDQLMQTTIAQKHQITFRECEDIHGFLLNSSIKMKTMGRNLHQEIEFFTTAGLAGKLAIELLTGRLCKLVR